MEYGSVFCVDIREDGPLNPIMHETTQTLAFLANLGWPEILIIGIVMLLLFGRRLPEVGRSLGQGIVEFKKGLKDVTDDIKNETDSAGKEQKTEPAKFDSANAPNGSDSTGTAHTNPSQMKAKVEPTGNGGAS